MFIDVGQSVCGPLERVQIFSWLEGLKIAFYIFKQKEQFGPNICWYTLKLPHRRLLPSRCSEMMLQEECYIGTHAPLHPSKVCYADISHANAPWCYQLSSDLIYDNCLVMVYNQRRAWYPSIYSNGSSAGSTINSDHWCATSIILRKTITTCAHCKKGFVILTSVLQLFTWVYGMILE